MTEPTEELDGIEVARVVITRVLTDDDLVDHVATYASNGADLGLAEALGMLELAKFTLVDTYTNGPEEGEQ